MFIFSVKPKAGKILLAVLLAAVLLLVTVLFFADGADPVQPTSGKAVSTVVESNAERIAYLKTFGWTVEEEACEIVDVAIPTEFNEVYQNYNAIQKEQGFDLKEYRGKLVRRYTYVVKNYPDHPENVRANLLVYNNQIIGGDICSLELDGFLHGFAYERAAQE